MERTRQGELFLFTEAILWSLFPVLAKLSFREMPVLFSAALTILCALPFFLIVLTIRRQWAELHVQDAYRPIFLATLIIGILYYGLVFVGTAYTSAGNASIILLMEIFFSFVILGALRKESNPASHWLGGALMVLGAALVLFPSTVRFAKGDLILLAAATVPPLGNHFLRNARALVGSSTIMLIRSAVSGIFFLVFACALEPLPSGTMILGSLPFLFLNGFFLMGLSKILWIEAIHRVSIAKAISLSAVSPLFTLGFAYSLLGEVPTAFQIAGVIPMIAGVCLLMRREFRTTDGTEADCKDYL
jgi:drug/metabolite transporter (DMT)-like permease